MVAVLPVGDEIPVIHPPAVWQAESSRLDLAGGSAHTKALETNCSLNDGELEPSEMASMAKRTFVIPASFPFRAMAESLAQDKTFVQDAFNVLRIEPPVFDQLLSGLGLPRFLDRTEIRDVVVCTLGDGELADKISRLIGQLSAMVQEAEEPAQEAMHLLRDALVNKCEDGDVEQRSQIAVRLERLILEPPGLTQQHKAEQLASLVEVELDQAQLICDVRPVFNDDRTEIQGAVPISRLILDLTRPDGTSVRTEVGITEAQILELRDRADAAIRKLDALNRFLTTPTPVLIPRTSATRRPES